MSYIKIKVPAIMSGRKLDHELSAMSAFCFLMGLVPAEKRKDSALRAIAFLTAKFEDPKTCEIPKPIIEDYLL